MAQEWNEKTAPISWSYYHTKKGNNFTDSMLGKTVFLTREEAEKALEEKK